MSELNHTDKTVAKFISANNNRDKIKLIALFARDAVVFDEGNQYKGIDEIKFWRKKINAGWNITMEIVGITPIQDGNIIDVLCTADFLSSPAIVRYHFILKNKLIAYLKIG
ncbi:MAG TPA: nuclear transport factor 2 family protein [Puia sp.]|nr:nuclear transport factor 2 family protein [Puia sp.]